MRKQFKEILENSRLEVKWKNIYTWQKEDINNLYEAVKEKRIKITGTPNKINITLKSNIEIKKQSNLAYLERDCYTILKCFYTYLGDKTKMENRFGTYQLN